MAQDTTTRYRRQLDIRDWGVKGQNKLRNSIVFVAGAGGLGSAVLYYLAAAGIGTIRICDNDSVDLSNLNRQILHNEDSIGKPKVESAFQTLSGTNSTIIIVPLKEKITPGSVEALVGDAHIIIDCLDNFPARMILNEISVEKTIPLVHGGITEFQGQISFFNPPHTSCLACIFPRPPRIKSPPVMGATAGIIGSLQAMEAIKYLTGIGELLTDRLLFFDGRGMNFELMKIKNNPRCEVCGKKE